MILAFVFILIIGLDSSTALVTYDAIGKVVFLPHVQKRCQPLSYDFSSSVHTASYVAKLLSSLYGSKNYTTEIGRLIIAHIQAEVVQTCSPFAPFSLDFTDDLRQLREKIRTVNWSARLLVSELISFCSQNETSDHRLFEPLAFVRQTLKMLRANDSIVGVRADDVARLVGGEERKLLRVEYHLLRCNPEAPRIDYRFCVSSVPNEQVHLAYRKSVVTTDRSSTITRILGAKSFVIDKNKSGVRNERGGYAIRVNSSFVLVPADDCYEEPELPSHFKICITTKQCAFRTTLYCRGEKPLKSYVIVSSRCSFQHHGFNNPKSFVTVNCRLSSGPDEEEIEFTDLVEYPILDFDSSDRLFSNLFDRVLFTDLEAGSGDLRSTSKKKPRRLVDLL